MSTTAPGTTDTLEVSIVKSFWLLRLLWKASRGRLLLAAVLSFAVCSVFPLLAFGVCWRENTLWLAEANEGRGLLEHYGTLSQFLACPVLLVLLFLLIRRVAAAAAVVANVSSLGLGETEAQRSTIDFLTCRSLANKVLFSLMSLFGAFCWVINLQNTRHPQQIYGNEIWDSSTYLLGYLVGRLFLAFEWIYLFPLVVYLALAAAITTVLAVRDLLTVESFELSIFAPDGCGGMRPLGGAMLAIAYVALPFVVVIVAHHLTHANAYSTLVFATIMVTAGLVAIAFLPFVSLHRLLQTKKQLKLSQLSERIRKEEARLEEKNGDSGALSAAVGLLASTALYQRTAAVRTWPYLPEDWFQWVLPLLPLLAGLIQRGGGSA